MGRTNAGEIEMTDKKDLIATDSEHHIEERLFQDYLEVNLYDLSVSSFLEASARHFGVFYEQDPYGEKDDRYLIN